MARWIERSGVGAAGVDGSILLENYYAIPIVSGHATPDLSQGMRQELDLTTSGVAIDAPISVPGKVEWTLIIKQDSTGGWLPTFNAGTGGYVGATGLPAMLNPAADTYSSLAFFIRPDGKSALKGIVTGVPVS